MLKRLKTTLAGLLLLIPLSLGAQYEIPDDLPLTERQPVVAVVNEGSGTGSAVTIRRMVKKSGDLQICYEEFIAAAHVVAMDNELSEWTPGITIKLWNTHQMVEAAVLHYVPEYDLALLGSTNTKCLSNRAVKLYEGYIGAGKPVWAVGYPNKYGPMGSFGSITTYNMRDSYKPQVFGPYLAHTAATYPGMSGGALLYHGQLAGMLVASHEDKHIWNLAVPAWRIKQFLEDYRGGKE